jgi:hypothetical protein
LEVGFVWFSVGVNHLGGNTVAKKQDIAQQSGNDGIQKATILHRFSSQNEKPYEGYRLVRWGNCNDFANFSVFIDYSGKTHMHRGAYAPRSFILTPFS